MANSHPTIDDGFFCDKTNQLEEEFAADVGTTWAAYFFTRHFGFDDEKLAVIGALTFYVVVRPRLRQRQTLYACVVA